MSNTDLGLGFVISCRDLASSVMGGVEKALGRVDAAGLKASVSLLGATERMAQGLLNFALSAKPVDDAMKNLRLFAGASQEQMDRLRRSLYSTDIAKLGFSADDAAPALSRLANLTNNADTALKLLNPSLVLARLTGSTAAEGAEALNRALNVFGISAGEAGRVNDVLAFGMQKFGVSAKDYVAGLQSMERGFQGTRASFEDVNLLAFLGTKRLGSYGEAAAAVGKLLEKATAAGPNAAGKKGLSASASRKLGGRGAASEDLIGQVVGLDKQFAGQSDQQLRFSLEQLKGKDAAVAYHAAILGLREAVASSGGKYKTTADAALGLRVEMIQMRGKGTELAKELTGMFTIIGATWSTIKTIFAEPLMKAFKPLIKGFERLSLAVLEFVESIPDNVKDAVAGFIVFAVKVGAVVGGVLALKGIFIAAFSILPGLIWPVVVALAPLALKVALIMAVFEGFKLAYEKNLGGFKDFIDGTVGKAILIWKGFMQAFSQGGFSGAVRDELNKAENAGLKQFVVNVYAFFKRLQIGWKALSMSFGAVMDTLGPVFQDLRDAFAGLGDAFGGSSDKAVFSTSQIVSVFSRVGEIVGKVVGVVVQVLTAAVDYIAGFVQGIREAFAFFQPTFTALGAAIGKLWDAFRSLFDAITGGGDSAGSSAYTLGSVMGKVFGAIVAGLAKWATLVVKYVTFVVDGFKEFIKFGKLLWDELKINFGLMAEFFTETLPGAFRSVGAVFRSIFSGIGDFFGGIVDKLMGILDRMLSFVGRTIARIPKGLRPAAFEGIIGAGVEADKRMWGRTPEGMATMVAAKQSLIDVQQANRRIPVPTLPIGPSPEALPAEAPRGSPPASSNGGPGFAWTNLSPSEFAAMIADAAAGRPIEIQTGVNIDGEKAGEAIDKAKKGAASRRGIRQSFS